MKIQNNNIIFYVSLCFASYIHTSDHTHANIDEQYIFTLLAQKNNDQEKYTKLARYIANNPHAVTYKKTPKMRLSKNGKSYNKYENHLPLHEALVNNDLLAITHLLPYQKDFTKKSRIAGYFIELTTQLIPQNIIEAKAQYDIFNYIFYYTNHTNIISSEEKQAIFVDTLHSLCEKTGFYAKKMISCLLKNTNIDINQKTPREFTALRVAIEAEQFNPNIVKFLLQKGADPLISCDSINNTVLHLLAQQAHCNVREEIIHTILSFYPQILSAKNKFNQTPAHVAFNKGYFRMGYMLAANFNAHLNDLDIFGKTPLDYFHDQKKDSAYHTPYHLYNIDDASVQQKFNAPRRIKEFETELHHIAQQQRLSHR